MTVPLDCLSQTVQVLEVFAALFCMFNYILLLDFSCKHILTAVMFLLILALAWAVARRIIVSSVLAVTGIVCEIST